MSSNNDNGFEFGLGHIVLIIFVGFWVLKFILWLLWDYIVALLKMLFLGALIGAALYWGIRWLYYFTFGKGAKIREIKNNVNRIVIEKKRIGNVEAIRNHLRMVSDDQSNVEQSRVVDFVHQRFGFTPEEIQRAESEQ